MEFARRICVRSPSITMAPSILESSNRRFEVNEMLSGKPSLPALSTFSESPTQIRAPRWPAIIMSSAVRSGCPGAVRRIASFSVGLNVSLSNSPPPCSGRSAIELAPDDDSGTRAYFYTNAVAALLPPTNTMLFFSKACGMGPGYGARTGAKPFPTAKNRPRGSTSSRPVS